MKSPSELAFEMLTSEDDGRVCEDIPAKACHDQPQNFTKHVLSLSLTKTADGLIDPKLVLSWILTQLGAASGWIGLLVPVREAGALLPQLFTAGYLRSLAQRKWVWAFGSLVQGICAGGMALAVIFLKGQALGATIVGLLAVLAVARSLCSVSYKDVLGKTVDESKRGTATGTASSVAAGLVILFAVGLASGLIEKMSLVLGGLFLAMALWIIAGLLFATLTEKAGATEGGGNPVKAVRENFKLLQKDRDLQRFIYTRGLLIATALAPPYMVAISVRDLQNNFGNLGWLVLASSAASLCSSYIWGRLADRSSRKVLLLSGLSAAITLAATVVAALFNWTRIPWVIPTLLFALMIAYQGVRLGRSTYLVDLADEATRAPYTALSNTIIGILLLAGSLFGLVSQAFGNTAVLACFVLMSLAATFTAYRMKEAKGEA